MKKTKECFDFTGKRVCNVCGYEDKACNCEVVEEEIGIKSW